MDYSKKGIETKQHYIKSTSRRLVSKVRITLFRFCIVLMIFLIIVGSFAGFGYVKGLIDSAPEIDEINVIPSGYTTTVYDREGNAIEQLIGAEANRVYVTQDKIPEVLKKAVISIEDERFYQHDGIDIRGIFRAFFLGLSRGDFDEGASTITQQLLKNQVFDGGRESEFMDRLERKIQEQYLAIQLEDKLNKDTILEYYLNTINLGSGTYGVQTASRRYFNKDVSDLTLSEAAVIAAIAQLPVYRNPITYPENNETRRAEILRDMLDQGYCTQVEYDAAMQDDVYSRIQSVNKDVNKPTYYTYFIDALIDQVMEDLQSKLGYNQTQASNLLHSGGLYIYTTQDPTIQKICDDVYSDESFFPEMGVSYWELFYALSVQKKNGETIHYQKDALVDYYKDYDDPDDLYVDNGSSKFSLYFLDKEDMQKKIDAFRDAMVDEGDIILGEKADMTIQPQSSFVVMDQHTGQVMAIIGGRGEKIGNRTLNRATNTKRQPGSTFKVLSTYLPALDNTTSGFTLASVQDDSGPFYYPGDEKEVNNWTSTKEYEGLTTLRRAIYNSMNIVTVKTLLEVTPKVGYDYLTKLGFTTLVKSRTEANGSVYTDIRPPLALGGLTDGVKNIELTAAYASIANSGVYTEPILYTKIVDHSGKVLLENIPDSEQVMHESTSWLLTNAMEDVVNVGTGKSYKLTTIDMPIAGKTGSTSDYNDLWFSGFSPYYTATIWSGFDNNRTQTDRNYQKKIWRTIMEQIHTELNLETKSFTKPDSVVPAKICTKSGKLAVEGLCDHYIGGDTTRIEYFTKGTEPTEKCDIHVKASICEESNSLATENCPDHLVKEGVYLNKTETGITNDTPFVLPSGSCKVHGQNVYEDEPFTPNPPNTGIDDDFDDDFLDDLLNDAIPDDGTYEDEPTAPNFMNNAFHY
ncbi:MAG: hypothetical protein K0S76_1349 [Herbinix sp.]|jgi:penicillin-binding protein 1A|nr:hypothetical protein [Herbinix sp.]